MASDSSRTASQSSTTPETHAQQPHPADEAHPRRSSSMFSHTMEHMHVKEHLAHSKEHLKHADDKVTKMCVKMHLAPDREKHQSPSLG
ncbi:hypothetical protein BDY17DRAFT_319872 [Neohortaea acidophila]|uniref:Uncharacterized protein n=1 Tax=Neohortaea acidophila TaxID=245834 RepID=A0A6A6Q4M0_9PEZI|nr:uncharacterized protein BDY17DRAFT_319872 [Neohortaea acidophila]KAF2487320.1 hypothetical protein BDY17DRAFT_319872 [Neohortaea acidophila]